MKYSSLEKRLNNLTINIHNKLEYVSSNGAARHFKDQLARSSLSFSLNYAEAHYSSSSKDFVYRMRICLRELNESRTCIYLLRNTSYAKAIPGFEILENETEELMRIFSASVKTAESNLKKK